MKAGLFRVEALAVALAATLGLVGLALASRRGAPDAPPGIRPHRVDVNTASRDELALLGVGSKAVDALVNGRPWTRVEDVAAALGQEAWARVGDAVTLGDVGPVGSGGR